ncbi:Vgr family protein, partial [Flavobacterium sp. ALJ2]|nr:Vgr family protein [Flavobacterium sp. ALJ2]
QAGDNFIVNAGKNVKIDAGENMDCSAGNNISQTAGNDLTQTASEEITESSDNRKEMVDKDFMRQANTSNEIASEVTIFSNKENLTLQSGKTVEVNSVEKSKMF